MEHKEIETSDSLMNWNTPVEESSNYNNNFNDLNSTTSRKNISENLDKDIDCVPFDKICPMCGETFQKEIAFADFQSHVESHFIGDIEEDSITDNFDNTPSSFENIL